MRLAISVRIWKVKLRMEIEKWHPTGRMVPSSSFGFSVQRYKKITYDKKNWLLKNKR